LGIGSLEGLKNEIKIWINFIYYLIIRAYKIKASNNNVLIFYQIKCNKSATNLKKLKKDSILT